VERPTVISTEAPVSSVEDRNGGEAEKSIQNRFLDSPTARSK